jgi:hypothetical protein
MAVITVWFLFANLKIKENAGDISACRESWEKFLLEEPLRIWNELKPKIESVPETPTKTEEASGALRSLFKDLTTANASLDKVEKIRTAPEEIIKAMRQFREYMVGVILFAWVVSLVAILYTFSLISSAFAAASIGYIALLGYLGLRTRLVNAREKWTSLSELLEQNGFKKPSVTASSA